MYLLPKKINQFSETIFDSDKNFGIGAVVKTPTDIMVEGGGEGRGGNPPSGSHRPTDFQS